MKEKSYRTFGEMQLMDEAKAYLNSFSISNQNLMDQSRTGQDGQISRVLLWDHATVKKLSFGNAICIPYLNKSALFLKTNLLESLEYPSSLFSVILVYHESDGKMKAEIVAGFPDSACCKVPGKFSGIIRIENLNGVY